MIGEFIVPITFLFQKNLSMDGFIKLKKENEVIFNEFGENISDTAPTESDFVSCKYYAATRNDVFDAGGGVFTQASFVITTKNMTVSGKQIALYDSQKNKICEKDCKSLERLEKIRRTKILI